MNEGRGRPFAWKLVWLLAPIGLLYAALTISGALPTVEVTRWTALAMLVTVGIVAGLRAPERPWRHGLVAGLMVALAAIWTQGAFLDTYFANNPSSAEVEIPFGWSARLATFVLGPLNAVVAALISGGVAWVARKAVGARFASAA